MCRTVGFLLLLLMLLGRARADRVQFVPHEHRLDVPLLHVYAPDGTHARPTPLLLGAAASVDRVLAHSTGRALSLPHAMGLRLAANDSAANAFWAPWRYARLSNLTLQLADALLELGVRRPLTNLRGGLFLRCNGSETGPTSVCATTAQYGITHGLASQSAASELLRQRRFQLVVDAGSARSSLPASLYFLLTRPHAVNGLAALPSGPQLSHAEAEATTCLTFSSAESAFTLCDRDVEAFFTMHAGEETTIRLGTAYWRSNFSAVVADGWTSVLFAQYTTLATSAEMRTLQALGAVTALLTIVLASRWATGPETITGALYLWHTGYRRQPQWMFDIRMTIGGILLLGSAAASVTLAHLAWARFDVPAGQQPVLLEGPGFPVLLAFFTAFGLLQFVLSTALFLWSQLTDGRQPQAKVERHWLSPYPVPVEVALARYMTHGMAALAFATLALVPLCLEGALVGDRILLFLLVPSALTLLFLQSYYTALVTGVAMRGLRTSGPANNRPLLFLFFALLQVLLLAGLVVVTGLFLLLPLMNVTSAYFSSTVNALGAANLVALVVVAGFVLLAWETITMLDQVAHQLRAPPAAEKKAR